MYEKMLIPVDGSEVSMNAARQGVKLAGMLGSTVSFLYVIDLAILTIPDAETGIANAEAVRSSFKAQGEAVLAKLSDEAAQASIKASTIMREGDVHEEILKAAEEAGTGIIVMGTHGRRGINRLILGSVAESVARRASCAVLLIRPEQAQ